MGGSFCYEHTAPLERIVDRGLILLGRINIKCVYRGESRKRFDAIPSAKSLPSSVRE